MKKQISILIIVLLIMMTCISVNAADGILVSQYFDGTIDSVQADGWSVSLSGDGKAEINDGALKLSENGSTGVQRIRKDITLPNTFTMEFKVKLLKNINGNGANIVTYFGGYRVFMRVQPDKVGINGATGALTSASVSTQIDQWYTYLVNVKDGFKADVYRKQEGEQDFTKVLDSVDLQAMIGNRIELFIEANADQEVEFDYFRIYNGLCVDVQKFTYDGQIAAGLESNDLEAYTDVLYGNGVGQQNVTLILCVFDADGMMLDTAFVKDSISPLKSKTLSVSLDLSRYSSELTGGTAELYLWDSITGMQPLVRGKSLD